MKCRVQEVNLGEFVGQVEEYTGDLSDDNLVAWESKTDIYNTAQGAKERLLYQIEFEKFRPRTVEEFEL